MSKSHRGKGINDQPAKGRGVCPLCNAEGIKLLYDHEINGEKAKICKYCNAAIKNSK